MLAHFTTPDQAFAAGALVVTPNNRLARRLVADYDRRQQRAGESVWASARALPWSAFLSLLWADALAADALPQPLALLNDAQCLRLWERAIEVDDLVLLNSRGAADLAKSAWERFHAHADAGETLGALAARGEDATTFVRWGRRYEAACRQHGASDRAVVSHHLVTACERAGGFATWLRGRQVACVGYVEFTPDQQRLLAALEAAGATVDRMPWPPNDAPGAGAANAVRAAFATDRDELAAALHWAGRAVRAYPDHHVGIAVMDLSARRNDVIALADDILCPQVYMNGQLEAPRPWDVSLGAPLADHPLVVTAFDILALASNPLPLAAAAALLRSPFLAGGRAAADRRAGGELAWREDNLHEVTLRRLQAALPADDPLGPGLDRLVAILRGNAAASAGDWARSFRDALAAVGWPGSDPQGSEAFQARDAWERALETSASLGIIEPRQRRQNALAALRGIATRTLFQPERPAARIQVMGLLEAAGLTFDKLWLAGVSAEAWPPPVQSDPLLPPAWQRARGYVPADPLRTLARARLLTAQLKAGAPEVVASHVLSDAAPPRAVSPLCAWPLVEMPLPELPAVALMRAAPALDTVVDSQLPALPARVVARGGVRIVELQSDCPFRAAAALRLEAEPWPVPAIGMSPMERGVLLHAALAHFWRDVRDHATLAALHAAGDRALHASVEAAVTGARATLTPQRWNELPPAVADGEVRRLTAVLQAWLETQELPRPSFTVRSIEEPATLTLGPLTVRFRIDRIDALQPGGGEASPDSGEPRATEAGRRHSEHVAIIDYKSGRTGSVEHWLLPRPVAPQAGLYALALQAMAPDASIDAVALAQVKSGELRSRGIANAGRRWEGLTEVHKVADGRFASLAELTGYWGERFAALTADFQQGVAGVAPRLSPLPCRHCDFKPLCRIGTAILEADVDATDEDDEPESGKTP